MNKRQLSWNVKKLTMMGMLFAMALLLQWIEYQLPPIFGGTPARIGLSNIVIVYALCVYKPMDTAILVILKSLFALMIRGLLAGIMSFLGGMFAFLLMWFFNRTFRQKISWIMLSVIGSLAHNFGQLIVLSFMMPLFTVFSLFPLMEGVGMVTGIVSGIFIFYAIKAVLKISK